ncbi:MAG: hypothetical protein ACXWUG_30595 [Polyangiales bacterium]
MPKKPDPNSNRPSRPDSADAFLRDGARRSRDDLASGLAEDFLASATSGEEQGEISAQAIVDEEEGGPFIPSTGKKEFARDIDASNPRGARKAAFPTANATPRKPR